MARMDRGSPPPGTAADKAPIPVERLVEVGPGIPREVKQQIIEAGRMVEKYEEFAATFGHGEMKDKLALVELLEQDDVFSPELMQRIENIATIVDGMLKEAQEKYDSAPPAQKPALGRRLRDRVDEINNLVQKINTKLATNGRPITASVFIEAMNAAVVKRLERRMRTESTNALMQKEPNNVHLPWVAFAERWKKESQYEIAPEEPKKGEFTTEEKMQFLKNAQFSSLPDGNTLQAQIRISGRDIPIHFSIDDRLNAATITYFVIDVPGMPLHGSLSRTTGELNFTSHLFLSVKEHFRVSGAQQEYQKLRAMVIDEIYRAWDSGVLKEESYIELAPEEIRTKTILETHPEPPAPAQAAEESNVERVTQTVKKTFQWFSPSKPAQPAPQKVEQTNNPSENKEKQRPYSTRRFTWRRVMSALKRCGVEIDMAHAHPKLRYEGRTSGYLNSHDKDTRHNRQVLRDTLRDLHIPFETFMDNLR